ncbi:MAG: HNH endonuclease signature motif containing protein [Mycobacterium sp.]
MTTAERYGEIRLRQLRRGITPKLRAFILGESDGGAFCHYCGFPAGEVDHIVPVSRGGGVALANLAPACIDCNAEKRDRTVTEWAAWRRANGRPWPVPHFNARLAGFLNRHGITPESVGEDVHGWIKRWPGGYEAMRAELQQARNADTTGGA